MKLEEFLAQESERLNLPSQVIDRYTVSCHCGKSDCPGWRLYRKPVATSFVAVQYSTDEISNAFTQLITSQGVPDEAD